MSGDAAFDTEPLIRRASTNDAEAIASVHTRTWQGAYRGQLPDRYLDGLSQDMGQRTEMWRTQISNTRTASHEVWVVATDKQLEGFVALGPARDADASLIGEVYAIYVNPDCWGRGFGRRLFSHATNRLVASGYSAAILWVLKSNARARGFYEIAGWAADGATKLQTLPDGTELHEVRYRISLARKNEES